MTIQLTTAQKSNLSANGYSYALVDKSKGDFGNRWECSKKQYVNALKGSARDTVIIGGTVAAGAAVAKNAKATNTIAGFVKKGAKIVTEDLKNIKLPEKIATPIANGMKKVLNTKNKTLALATVAFLGISYLISSGRRTSFEAGKIDEKYDNRAKMQKALDK